LFQHLLSDRDTAAIKDLLQSLISQYDSAEDPQFLQEVGVYAQELPRGVRHFLNEFRVLEPPSGLCTISSYPVSDERIGPTPPHWACRSVPSPMLAEEMFFILCGSLLGDVIGWSTQQRGKLIHDILPIKGHEYRQISSASKEPIWWHTEDAFHQYRADYVGLMCLRNHSLTATTIVCIDQLKLNEAHVRVLFEPRFIFRPDYAHVSDPSGDDIPLPPAPNVRSKLNDEEAASQIKKVAVLFGDPSSPYIRLDPYFMDRLDDDQEAQAALDALCEAIDQKLSEVVLQAGDICFIDNFRAVHGRRPFEAQFEGRDRWLKRLLVARDLRKSRSARCSATSRIIW
jgi:enduracididine beta-hydroxylase